jgi:hypothetical protein
MSKVTASQRSLAEVDESEPLIEVDEPESIH